MGPEESMQIQSNLGSTIAMAFDECPSSVASREYVQNSVDRTTRWLKRCRTEMARLNTVEDTINPHQLLFGINQGAIFPDIRIDHAKAISELELDGYAVGGLAVGESQCGDVPYSGRGSPAPAVGKTNVSDGESAPRKYSGGGVERGRFL